MKSRTHRRLVAIGIALTASFVALAGCTIPEGDSGGAAPDGKVTLRFWHYYQGTQKTWLEQQTTKFEEKNPDIKVELVEVVGKQQDQKLLASVATGNGPDLFINNIVVDFPTLVAGGVMKDMTKEWESFADKDMFPESAVWKDDGKVYNLMSYTNLLGMYYNKDILSEYGLTPPKTLDDLEKAMAKIKAGGKYKGLALSGAPTVEGAWLFAPQLLGQGINYCNFEGPEVQAAFTRIERWSQEGYTPIAAATWDQNAAWQQFMTGKYAFAFNGNWQLGNVKEASFAYGTGQFPAPVGGESVVYPGGEGFAIGAKSKHPEEAWKFLEEAVLSSDGGESVYKEAGSIPVRSDVASIPELEEDEMVQPFVEAAQTSGAWPNNVKTADMQTALGKSVSSVISGQKTAHEGYEKAVADNAAALKAGGGSCA